MTMWMTLGAAWACGGLACAVGPGGLPVIQNAEQIAFGIDGENVEVHVQVSYEGPPDAFAWIIPVGSADPEVFISSEALFQTLDLGLAPTFSTNLVQQGNCSRFRVGCASESSIGSVDFIASEPDTGGGVAVSAEGTVGPYDYVVLEGSSDSVTGYLQDNAFDVTPEVGPALLPYVTSTGRFLAIRLNKDADTGDIAPLGFRYPGDEASIPIQLTAIAAAEDMGVQVHVFGEHRAVPANYLHVVLDEAAIDWAAGGSNYYDIVARGVDEAGGHGFVTEYAGPTDALAEQVWAPWQEQEVDALRTATEVQTWLSHYYGLGLPEDQAADYAFDGFRDEQGIVSPDVDLAALTAQVDARLFEPRRRAEALFDHPWVTRMATTLDPSEMTLDPIFRLAPWLDEPVDNAHRVDFIQDCRGRRTAGNAQNRIQLADGRVYELEGADTSALVEPGASVSLRIEDLSGDSVELIVDNTEAAREGADRLGEGGGCTSSVLPSGLFGGLGLGALALVRRKH